MWLARLKQTRPIEDAMNRNERFPPPPQAAAAQHEPPHAPVPGSGYQYGPGFSQSGGGYIETETRRPRSTGGSDYQQVRPWGPQDGMDEGGRYAPRDYREPDAPRHPRSFDYGPDIAPPRDHRGRGPKNYRRSDERLGEQLHQRLSDDPEIDASGITLEVTNGRVALSGEVESRRAKHHVEDLVDACPGVVEIDNRLRIAARDGR